MARQAIPFNPVRPEASNTLSIVAIFMWIPWKRTDIFAQINAFQEKNFGLLMPGDTFMNTPIKY